MSTTFYFESLRFTEHVQICHLSTREFPLMLKLTYRLKFQEGTTDGDFETQSTSK